MATEPEDVPYRLEGLEAMTNDQLLKGLEVVNEHIRTVGVPSNTEDESYRTAEALMRAIRARAEAACFVFNPEEASDKPPLSQNPWFHLGLVLFVLLLASLGGVVADARWAWWVSP